jgi:tRNA wybutosine-synthesizing protein 1
MAAIMAHTISETRAHDTPIGGGDGSRNGVLDIEDMGKLSRFTKEQLTERLRGDLSKQGYKLVGSHSAVKMCRWTKNSMRGRGGCYKHTFYGITSYQCMEMTPNLACASKCTFCWRHHKNPTGTEWKWKIDEPEEIVASSLENHYNMIKALRGVPGVTEERFQQAHTVRHCALSLVGEPIFYPKINRLLGMLHERGISTFLVTNAQFPEAMRSLVPVTQLYVSIDAPNKETLKKIDRPLYRDFWERYIECLEIIREKKQRTVFRLTLVQKANMSDLEGYSELIKIGMPDFIEIKGVTFCGTSKANKLTMENVPWHEQVVEFAQELLSYLPEHVYELACEHSHSNCVLIANKKFKIDNKWHTWIDYEKFFELINATSASGECKDSFTGLDYAARTPDWAVFGSEESGFDPEHRRWIRKDHKLKLLKERLAAQGNQSSSDDEIFFDANEW